MSKLLEKEIKHTISIPDYARKFINPNLHLVLTPKVCCPFHEEDTPSFSYSPDKGIWSCFGSCKFGGDVISMHQKNYKYRTREEATTTLARILNISTKRTEFSEVDVKKEVDSIRIELLTKMSIAEKKTKSIEDRLALDYIMSVYKQPSELIEDLDAYILYRTN